MSAIGFCWCYFKLKVFGEIRAEVKIIFILNFSLYRLYSFGRFGDFVDCELERIWKEALRGYFKALYQHFLYQSDRFPVQNVLKQMVYHHYFSTFLWNMTLGGSKGTRKV
jgi:hypothetical protein